MDNRLINIMNQMVIYDSLVVNHICIECKGSNEVCPTIIKETKRIELIQLKDKF